MVYHPTIPLLRGLRASSKNRNEKTAGSYLFLSYCIVDSDDIKFPRHVSVSFPIDRSLQRIPIADLHPKALDSFLADNRACSRLEPGLLLVLGQNDFRVHFQEIPAPRPESA